MGRTYWLTKQSKGQRLKKINTDRQIDTEGATRLSKT